VPAEPEDTAPREPPLPHGLQPPLESPLQGQPSRQPPRRHPYPYPYNPTPISRSGLGSAAETASADGCACSYRDSVQGHAAAVDEHVPLQAQALTLRRP
jgi:hypothetical protein